MTTIPNFPESLLREHASWHRNMRRGMRSGVGVEFLEFHQYFMRKSLEWYRTKGYDSRLVEPWSSIPSEIKRHPRWTRRLEDAENRIFNSLGSFRSSEELGRFIQASTLHAAVHRIGSVVFNDNDFDQVSFSPRSTLFYNWHGLIDNWWRQFE